MTDWQPIKKAPKDRSIIIGWFRPAGHGLLSTEWNTRCAWWDKEEKAWTDWAVESFSYEEVQHYNPTHWMPLPEPPKG